MSDTLYRDRVLALARAQERLRQARDLANSAAGELAELGLDGRGNKEPGTPDLKAEVNLACEASKRCREAVDRLETQIRELPVS